MEPDAEAAEAVPADFPAAEAEECPAAETDRAAVRPDAEAEEPEPAEPDAEAAHVREERVLRRAAAEADRVREERVPRWEDRVREADLHREDPQADSGPAWAWQGDGDPERVAREAPWAARPDVFTPLFWL